MKSIKILPILLCVLLIGSILFTACGKQKSDSTKDEAAPGETTVVLETTGNGGTIEQDAEGNRITKDEKGNVLSVEDKDGKPVDVERYISTHSWVVSDDSSGTSGGSEKSAGSDGSSSSGRSDGSGISGDTGGKSSSGKGSGSSDSGSSDRKEIIEESIPVIIATIPDEDDMEKLPDF